MNTLWVYTLGAVIVVSLISFVGAVTLTVRQQWLQKVLLYLVSFSAGALLGDVFLHMLPEMFERGFGPKEGWYILAGITFFFVLERFIGWHHSHTEHSEEVHSVVYLTLIGDAFHNFIDGLIIAASFLVSIPLGISTTLAVIFHEVPHEFGNFAILVHGGWSAQKALRYNFLSALPAVLGALVVMMFAQSLSTVPAVLLSFAASSFIYISMSDLIPELHEEKDLKNGLIQLVFFLFGIGSMALLLLLE